MSSSSFWKAEAHWNRTTPPPKTGRKGNHLASVAKRYELAWTRSCCHDEREADCGRERRVERTVKKESPGPNMMEGRIIVDFGLACKNISSAAALVRWLS